MSRKKYVYALYKGDEFIDLGTLEELAKKEGVKPHTIAYYQTEAYKRKAKNNENRRVLIKIEEDY